MRAHSGPRTSSSQSLPRTRYTGTMNPRTVGYMICGLLNACHSGEASPSVAVSSDAAPAPSADHVTRPLERTGAADGGCSRVVPLPDNQPGWSARGRSPTFCGTKEWSRFVHVTSCETPTAGIALVVAGDTRDEFFYDRKTDRLVARTRVAQHDTTCAGDLAAIATPACEPTAPVTCVLSPDGDR
jgi:hypothetical protein